MAEFTLVVGYRSVSSWSLRAWLMMRKTGAAFEEVMVRYRSPEGRRRLDEVSPSGKVPLLIHDVGGRKVTVWETIAIGEYLNDCFPGAGLWPFGQITRAFARAVAAEMHAGFAPLRQHMTMELYLRVPGVGADQPGVAADIARIQAIWNECRSRHGAGGPFLFGARFGIADAMYAPVCARFRTYGVPLDPVSQAYCDAILADPDFQAWEELGRQEPPPEPLP